MSTRSVIGIEKKDGSIDAVYCHWDGYPENNGKLLDENYNTKAKAEKLVKTAAKKGYISSLGESIASSNIVKADFGLIEFKNEDDYRKNFYEKADGEYAYLFKDGKWYYSGDYGGVAFRPMEGFKYAEGGEVKKDDRSVSEAEDLKAKRQKRKDETKLRKKKGVLRKDKMKLKKEKVEVKKEKEEVKKVAKKIRETPTAEEIYNENNPPKKSDCKEEIKKVKKEIGKKMGKRFAEEEKDKKDWIKLQQIAEKRADECEREVEECEQEEGWLREDVGEEKGKRDEDATMLIGGMLGVLLGIFLGRR